jgi:hypothetical protein
MISGKTGFCTLTLYLMATMTHSSIAVVTYYGAVKGAGLVYGKKHELLGLRKRPQDFVPPLVAQKAKFFNPEI